MSELLRFVFTTKCGDKLTGEMIMVGHYDPHLPLRVNVSRRKPPCDKCEAISLWKEAGRTIFPYEFMICPALGLLTHRNGTKISYPLGEDTQ